jgi:excisionase family DNA binding protein
MTHMNNNHQDLLTTNETADYLRLKKSTLASWRTHRSNQELKFIKLGSRVLYSKESVMAFITANVK